MIIDNNKGKLKLDKEKTYSQQFKDGYNYNESQVNFKTININEGRSEQ